MHATVTCPMCGEDITYGFSAWEYDTNTCDVADIEQECTCDLSAEQWETLEAQAWAKLEETY